MRDGKADHPGADDGDVCVHVTLQARLYDPIAAIFSSHFLTHHFWWLSRTQQAGDDGRTVTDGGSTMRHARSAGRAGRTLSLATATLLAGALLAACSGSDDATPTPTEVTATATATASPTESTPTNTPRPTPTFPPTADPRPVLVSPAYSTVELDRPVDLTSYPLGGYELAIVDQSGIVYGISEGAKSPLLDITDRVNDDGNEEGLLSIALDPQFSTNHQVWLYYSASSPKRTVLSRFTAALDGVLDPDSELVVLEVEQPYTNHNGGSVRFGPDRMLYLGLGDGGAGGDPNGNGQNVGTLLGSVIRIDVSAASEAQPYAIPSDNPFVDQAGARGEIWAYGLRNPWRMSFDTMTGELWVGDVGQGDIEEIDILRSGENYGWNITEGDECYEAATCDRTGLVEPVAVYSHAGGRCSVTGGVVARRAAATSVEGAYIYGDFCSGDLWAISAGRAEDGVEPVLIASGLGNIASIAQVGNQIYVLTFGQALQRLVDQ
jgi:glucose/arabinose dehydrogenase